MPRRRAGTNSLPNWTQRSPSSANSINAAPPPGSPAMSRPRFAELDYQITSMGALSLRRRVLPGTETEVYEVKLDDDFLMSSLFTAGEVDLARKALAEAPERDRKSTRLNSSHVAISYA